MWRCLEKNGAVVIALVFDGIYFRPFALEWGSQSFSNDLAVIEEAYGIKLHVKNLDGQVIGPSEAVSDNSSPDFIEVVDEADEPLQCDLSGVSNRTDQKMTNFPGQMTCLLSALLSMDVINGEPSQGQGQEVKGPLTYRQVQDMYRPLAFHRVVFEELLSTPGDWQYILHVNVKGGVGHAIGLSPDTTKGTFLVHDSRKEFLHEVSERCFI